MEAILATDREAVLMKRLSIVAIVGLPMLLTAACASTSHLVAVDNAPGSSFNPTHSSAPASACESTPRQGNSVVMVDWVDFVRLDGIEYIAGLDGQVPPVASAQLGAVVGRVRCQLSALKFSEQPGPSVDGDAAYLRIGTEMHAVHGFKPSCRLAARVEGANRVYLAHHSVGGYSKAVPCAQAP
jgi:hypothetical protein